MLSDTELYTLIHNLTGPATVRATNTGKYFIANEHHAMCHGFKNVEASLDITPQEVYHHRNQQLEILEGSLMLEAQHRKIVEHLNDQADQSKKPLAAHICTLFPTGFIADGMLKKIPILGYTQPVVAIFTFFEDTTHTLDLFKLYRLYKKHYPSQRAMSQFLSYLKIKKYFSKLPTNQEITILLILRENPIAKYAAKLLGISYRTVEEYKARLRAKLSCISLEDLLVLLRMYPHQPLHAHSDAILKEASSH